ncbi:phosphotransferase family protein [Cytobacillus sp. IB215665]|uniref:phosphotransferase family protein n=1 Tax=Cytobacillus sp. IB215665 TaxID=3097357 RepID=UPI002A12DA0C|nr:phosphotransferase family protein [Cytobacillus sp. IB215665]MDX8367477.1 phosphotransferase family protein [Cytobacillus sp. IB215665]
MEHILGNEWEIYPAGGATGEAYFARFNERKLFLKRNSSPFLAVLSAEGIVPKLVWTKRMANGDVITAQQWLNGRELKHADMIDIRVVDLLQKIHNSTELLRMLTRLEKKPLLPEMIINELLIYFPIEETEIPDIKFALTFLQKELPAIEYNNKVVCHCDINHNNWLLSETNELYLIDWDGAMIADPAIDIGMLLYRYIPKHEWSSWLERYGIELTSNLHARMKWYVIAQTLMSIHWYKTKNKEKEFQNWLSYLNELLYIDK